MKREAIVLAKKIRSLDIWDLQLLREFCTIAGLGEAFECADSCRSGCINRLRRHKK